MPDLHFDVADPTVFTLKEFVSIGAYNWENFVEPIVKEIHDRFHIDFIKQITSLEEFDKVFHGIPSSLIEGVLVGKK